MLLVFASVLQSSIYTASAQTNRDNQLSELTPRNWKEQTIDPNGEGVQLILDSQNNPHILYWVNNMGRYYYERKYNVGINYVNVNETGATNRVITEGINGYLFLDSADNPRIIYQVSNHYDDCQLERNRLGV